MNCADILIKLDALIHKLDSLMDIMLESTKEVIDLGNVNYELKNAIDKLDGIIDSMVDSKEKSMLESAKYDITYATLDIIDNVDIFDKINRLGNARITIINAKAKLNVNGHL